MINPDPQLLTSDAASIEPDHWRLSFLRIGRLALPPLALSLASGCGSAQSSVPPKLVPTVSAEVVHVGSVPTATTLPARVVPSTIAEVRARVDGIVQKRNFVEGAGVAAGTLLYQIDPAPYQAAEAAASANVEKAAATLESANSLANRYAELVKQNGISQQAYDNAVASAKQAAAELDAARAALTTARINLGYTRVTSPITGTTSISLVTQGAYVQSSSATLLTTVQQLDPIYVDMQQPSVDALELRTALADGSLAQVQGRVNVRLVLEDGSTYPLPGELLFTGTTVNQSTGTTTLRASFPNPHGVLLPGMFLRATVQWGTDPKVVLVPPQALTHNPQGQAVVTVLSTDKHHVNEHVVQTAGLVHGNWAVSRGLNDGDAVVVGGLQGVSPGALVNAVYVENVPAPAAQQAEASAPPNAASTVTTSSASQG